MRRRTAKTTEVLFEKPSTASSSSTPPTHHRDHSNHSNSNSNSNSISVGNSHGLDRDINAFFARHGFDKRTREKCDRYARTRFPNLKGAAEPTWPQGYCSYTLGFGGGGGQVLQFRPDVHRLDMVVCQEVKGVFGRYAPAVTYLGSLEGIPRKGRERRDEGLGGGGEEEEEEAVDEQEEQGEGDDQREGEANEGEKKKKSLTLHVYLQDRIPGVPLSELIRSRRATWRDDKAFRKRLVKDLAKVFALSFRHRRHHNIETVSDLPAGKVGSSLRWRLDLLRGLPSRDLLKEVLEVRQSLTAIEGAPWCLTHGDLLPSNMMVDPRTGRLTGLVDWAEAEWLPFGMALYGLEEVLGREVQGHGYQFYTDAETLRRRFWTRLLVHSCHRDLGAGRWATEIDLARTLGTLLWKGIAFDGGRVDHVVERGRDDAEIRRLEAFLAAPSPLDELRAGVSCLRWFSRGPLAVRRAVRWAVSWKPRDDDGNGGRP